MRRKREPDRTCMVPQGFDPMWREKKKPAQQSVGRSVLCDEYTKLIDDTLEVAEEIFNDKEIGFLFSIRSRRRGGRGLTPKQASWLKKLHARACQFEAGR